MPNASRAPSSWNLVPVGRRWLEWFRIGAGAGSEDSLPVALDLYRLLSWALTSILFLWGSSPASWPAKLVLVAALLAAALGCRYFYRRHRERPLPTGILAGGEVMALSLLVVPTGGLASPFIWYALNPILVAAVALPRGYAWVLMASFLALVAGLSNLVAGAPFSPPGGRLPELALVLALATLATQVLAGSFLRERRQSQVLTAEKNQLEATLTRLSSLYLLVEAVSLRDSLPQLLQNFAGIARPLLGAEQLYLAASPDGDRIAEEVWTGKGCETAYPPELAKLQGGESRRLWALEPDNAQPRWLDYRQSKVVHLPVRVGTRVGGLLAVAFPRGYQPGPGDLRLLSVLANLAGVAMERYATADVKQQILLLEEQNRIAGELHDGAAQRLFGITCASYRLQETWEHLSPEEVTAQIRRLGETAQLASRELRGAIYQLQERKPEAEEFVAEIRGLLDEIAHLHQVKVEAKVQGEQELPLPMRRALVRIVREAAGNAIRHGKSDHLEVRLLMSSAGVFLEVKDDGVGITPQSRLESRGLGLRNMERMAEAQGGRLSVSGAPGLGTTVIAVIPLRKAPDEGIPRGGAVHEIGNN